MPAHHTTHTAQGTSPQFIKQPANQTAYLMATLDCSAAGSPQPTISWYKDNLAVQLSTRVSQDGGNLVITSLQTSDAGAYYCVAQNSLGLVQSLTGHLTLAGEWWGGGGSAANQPVFVACV